MPRENWFQYIRRVYATAIYLPCSITLLYFISNAENVFLCSNYLLIPRCLIALWTWLKFISCHNYKHWFILDQTKLLRIGHCHQGVWNRREIQLTRPALPYDYTCFADGYSICIRNILLLDCHIFTEGYLKLHLHSFRYTSDYLNRQPNYILIILFEEY